MSATVTYTIPQLDRMILLALQLGYHDDVRHWREVRATLSYRTEAADGLPATNDPAPSGSGQRALLDGSVVTRTPTGRLDAMHARKRSQKDQS